MLTQYIFWFLTFVAVFSAVGMIFSKNPVYSVLSLIVTFFAIAGHYFLLNAPFLGAVHVIVYAGAIMVLFLYVIMMLNLNNLQETRKGFLSKALAVVSGGVLMLVLVSALHKADIQATSKGVNPEQAGLVENIGTVLFKEYLLPFELASILFLAAMVGAVYLSKKSKA
jgi:NADH-quinone oxidoreductase subunit J